MAKKTKDKMNNLANYKPLVRQIASKYGGSPRLIQAGTKGLVWARHLYHDTSCDFEDYARWFIEDEIRRELPLWRKIYIFPRRVLEDISHWCYNRSSRKICDYISRRIDKYLNI